MLFAAALLASAAAYPGAPPPQRRDLSWSSHYASTENDPALPALPVWPLPASGSFPSGSPGAACLTPFFSISCAAGSACKFSAPPTKKTSTPLKRAHKHAPTT